MFVSKDAALPGKLIGPVIDNPTAENIRALSAALVHGAQPGDIMYRIGRALTSIAQSHH